MPPKKSVAEPKKLDPPNETTTLVVKHFAEMYSIAIILNPNLVHTQPVKKKMTSAVTESLEKMTIEYVVSLFHENMTI